MSDGSKKLRGTGLDWFDVLAKSIIALATTWLAFESLEWEKQLADIQANQKQQEALLDRQRLLLEERQADLTFRLDLSEHVLDHVSNPERAPAILALVETLPSSDYTTALIQVLRSSDIERVRRGAETTLRQRAELVYESPDFQRSSADTAHLPNITVYLCEERVNAADAIDLVNRVGETLAAAGLADAVKGGIWGGTSFNREIPADARAGKTLIVYDTDPDESWEADQIQRALADIGDLPPVSQLQNTGSSTPWSLSVLVCPEEPSSG